MKNVLRKDTMRDVKKSLGRFMSILIIVALGVAFFVGVKSSPMVMKATSDKYYDDYNMMDIRVLSTFGLTDSDIKAIKDVEGVYGVTPAYSKDVIINHDSKELVLKIHSLDINKFSEEEKDYINRLNVIEGRLPEKSGEVVIENTEVLQGVELGAKIKLESGTDSDLNSTLKNTEYTVVGKVETPYYLSFQKGSTNLGSGVIDSYIMIPQSDFKMEAYTEAFVTVEGARVLDTYKEEYSEKVEKVAENIMDISEKRSKIRFDEITANLPEQVVTTMKMPEWMVLDRDSHYSFVDYENAAGSIEAISRIFPIFFFLVAALVSLTTMTRMVDEQRINIGTLKALGYSRAAIASKFLYYALAASLIGSVVGAIIGNLVFPPIVMDAYAMMYVLPETVNIYNTQLLLGATILAVAVTTLSTYFAVNKELIESPSALMRPRAPKEGKRILLERIPFIWNRFNFIGKVTVRNIFRYKKRFLMTVFGIAGCTALIVTGFGIKDSIKTVADKQFGEVFKYQITVNIDRKTLSEEKNEIAQFLIGDNRALKLQFANSESGLIETDGIEKPASIFVPYDLETMDDFIVLRERKSQEKLSLNDNGIIVTEKIASLLKIKVGDVITIKNSQNEEVEAEVSGITENYVSNYIYISPKYYDEIFKADVKYNSILTVVAEGANEVSLMKDIVNKPGVSGVSSSTTFKESFSDTVNSLNVVVLVMIISAGALAFVVLYNLTNVNISERMREIATIKVLGFYDKEVSAYIYRENIILTLIGTIVGVGLGTILHKFIMVTVEMENVMFGRNIDVLSYVIAATLTIFFAILVNYAMYYKLKNVKMVESLKSVD